MYDCINEITNKELDFIIKLNNNDSSKNCF